MRVLLVGVVLAMSGCLEFFDPYDLRGPLVLSVHSPQASEGGNVSFVVRVENHGQEALVGVLVFGTTNFRYTEDEANYTGWPGRIYDFPYNVGLIGRLAFDPTARLDAGAAWEQMLNATFAHPRNGTEDDPIVFSWRVKSVSESGGRWDWAYTSCTKADGTPSLAAGCDFYFEYFVDENSSFYPGGIDDPLRITTPPTRVTGS